MGNSTERCSYNTDTNNYEKQYANWHAVKAFSSDSPPTGEQKLRNRVVVPPITSFRRVDHGNDQVWQKLLPASIRLALFARADEPRSGVDRLATSEGWNGRELVRCDGSHDFVEKVQL